MFPKVELKKFQIPLPLTVAHQNPRYEPTQPPATQTAVMARLDRAFDRNRTYARSNDESYLQFISAHDRGLDIQPLLLPLETKSLTANITSDDE